VRSLSSRRSLSVISPTSSRVNDRSTGSWFQTSRSNSKQRDPTQPSNLEDMQSASHHQMGTYFSPQRQKSPQPFGHYYQAIPVPEPDFILYPPAGMAQDTGVRASQEEKPGQYSPQTQNSSLPSQQTSAVPFSSYLAAMQSPFHDGTPHWSPPWSPPWSPIQGAATNPSHTLTSMREPPPDRTYPDKIEAELDQLERATGSESEIRWSRKRRRTKKGTSE
jgi:hypothetical protein